jgi:hypothetical protein
MGFCMTEVSMFEVGKKYEFHMLEAGDDVTFWGTIERYEHPLIKLEDTDALSISFGDIHGEGDVSAEMPATPGRIINVTSPNFVSAVQQD